MKNARLHFTHCGDPCWYCNTPHDVVAIGPCQAFTGEIRPPRRMEKFRGIDNRIKTALFDFEIQEFEILKECIQ